MGVTDSFEVFQEEMQKAYEAMSGELTDEELLAVAGGMSTGQKVAVGLSVSTGVVTAGCFAAGWFA